MDLSNWSKLLLYLGAVLAGASVVVSLLSSVLANRASDATQRRTDLAVAESKERAAEASSNAARANEASETLRAENLQLQARVEKERAERLRLELRLTSRTIDPNNFKELAAAAKMLPTRKIIVRRYSEREPHAYATQIIDALRKGGIDIHVEDDPMPDNPPYGIQISGSKGLAVSKALVDANVLVFAVTEDDRETTEIRVGRKLPAL